MSSHLFRSRLARVVALWCVLQSAVIPVQSANAFTPLVAVAVGAAIFAAGALLPVAALYQNPTYAAGDVTFDSVKNQLKQKVQEAVVFSTVSAGVAKQVYYGISTSIGIDWHKICAVVQAHMAQFPSLSSLLASWQNSGSATVSGVASPEIATPVTLPASSQPFNPQSSPQTFYVCPTSGNVMSSDIYPGGVSSITVSLPGQTPSWIVWVGPWTVSGGGTAVNSYGPAQPTTTIWGRPDVSVCTSSQCSHYWPHSSLSTDQEYNYTIYTPAHVITSQISSTLYPPGFVAPVPTGLNEPGAAAALPQTQQVESELDSAAALDPSSVVAPPDITQTQIKAAAAQVVAQAAQDSATQAAAQAAANPTDAAAQVAATQAQQAANQAAVNAQSQAQAANVVSPSVSVPSPPALPTPPVVPTLDFWAPIRPQLDALDQNLATHEPFATFQALPGMLAALTAPPVAPVIDLKLPHVGAIHIDLSPWNYVAVLVRSGLSLTALVGLVFFVIKVWT